MKTRKNRKTYNFSEKQKRRDACNNGNWFTPRPWYVNIFNKRFRAQERRITKAIVDEYIPKDFPFPINGRNTAKWFWS